MVKLQKLFFISIFLFAYGAGFSQHNSAHVANRRTAIRYLNISKQYASEKNWSEADSNARLGLAYDENISDLWYLRAVSEINMNKKTADAIELVEKSLKTSDWVDYNKDNARVLYADLLSRTLRFDDAIEQLDNPSFIYSADAEFIRAKCFYNLGGDFIKKAREKIDSVKKVYPDDVRFAEVFYSYEFKYGFKEGILEINPEIQKIADSFLNQLNFYRNPSPEVELYSILFCNDENRRIRMLKSFNAKNLKTPFFCFVGLYEKILDEQKAMDYFYEFADSEIDYGVVKSFVSLIQDEDNKKELSDYLNSYNGNVLFDTDGDLVPNIYVDYVRGRPQKISYDKNQDDIFEWVADCDFGVPVKLRLVDSDIDLIYSSWPYIKNAIYKLNGNIVQFNLLSETLSWSPFEVVACESIKKSIGLEFFIPKLYENNPAVTENQFILSCSSYETPSEERKNARISVTLTNGLPLTAIYTQNDKVYGVAEFSEGVPVSRIVDMDGDGVLETTEIYGFSKDSEKFLSAKDELQIITNIFGSPEKSNGIYLKMIQVDRTGDTIPDFIEEYLEDGGKISSWDYDSDGLWEIQHVKMYSEDKETLVELAKFRMAISDKVITVKSENGIPVTVFDGEKQIDVIQGFFKNFYWISDNGETAGRISEEKISNELNQLGEQAVSIIVESENHRFYAVKIEKNIFAKRMPDSEVKDE